MNGLELAIIAGAGVLAGGINAAAGGGSLVTFPTLVALGIPPLTANVTNTVGLVPGYIGGAIAYRSELQGQSARATTASIGAGVGAVGGAVILLSTPAAVFSGTVPVLIILASILLAFQPALLRFSSDQADRANDRRFRILLAGAIAGFWGGYFNAALGVVILALFGVILPDLLQRINALKALVSFLISSVAATFFIMFASVDFLIVAILAVSSLVGGRLGGDVARRMPDSLLRTAIVFAGLIIGVAMLVRR